MNNFGPHLFLDAEINKISSLYLDDLDYIFNFMNALPDMIGMTKITQPYVFRYSGLNPEDGGITGCVIIAESHISIHTFAKKNYIFFDIFSCKPFDYENVVSVFKSFFSTKRIDYSVSYRGLSFPR